MFGVTPRRRKNVELFSIREAAARGIERVRKPVWAHACTHLKIDIVDSEPGPWTHLFDPFNMECNGKDPVSVLCIQMDYEAKEWAQHEGPLNDSDEYRAAVAAYSGTVTPNQKAIG
jgi:hypothetical protein